MHCPICARYGDALFLIIPGGNMCRICKNSTPQERYDTLRGRIDGTINQLRLLAH